VDHRWAQSQLNAIERRALADSEHEDIPQIIDLDRLALLLANDITQNFSQKANVVN
jgi:hypothetical protein